MVENLRTRTGATGGGGLRSTSARRWGSVIAGSTLALYGITRRSRLGIALATAGATIALLGATRNTYAGKSSAWASILVNCSPQDAFRFWRDFQNLPRFMNRLDSVTVLDDRRSQWIAAGPKGRPIRWEAEITSEQENQHIAWQSLPNSDIQVDGRVEFKEAPAGRGTFINAQLKFSSLPGMNGKLASFLNKSASFVLRQELRRLEALLETGEIPTIEGQSHGRRDVFTGVMRVADPTRPIPASSTLKDVFAERRRSA